MPTKRGDSKYWQIVVAGVRRSSGTTDRRKAEALEHRLNAEAWDKANGLIAPTWDEACLDWFSVNATLRSIELQAHMAKWLKPHLTGKRLNEITRDMVHKIMQTRGVSLEERTAKNTTANRHVQFVGKIIRYGGRTPPRFIHYPPPMGRDRWLSVEDWQRIEAVMPEDLRQLATFSLATGLREANVMWMQWDWIDGENVIIPATHTKTGRSYGLPLNRTAMGIIKERRNAKVVHATYVFLLAGRPAYRMALWRAWNSAVAKAEVKRITYHGLRHTFASWMVQAGVPIEIVNRLGQWSNRGVSHNYMHFDTASLRPWAERFDDVITGAAARVASSS
jgi:integrase